MITSFEGYFYTESVQTSPLLQAPVAGWRRMAGRAVIWTGLGMLCWVWAVPFGWRALVRNATQRPLLSFLLLWILPPFLFSLFIHIGDPDQALASISGLCLVGGICLNAVEEKITRRSPDWLPGGMLAGWIVFANLPLFFGTFLPPRREATTQFRGLTSLTDAFRIAAYESSYSRVRWVDEMAAKGFQQLQDLQAGRNGPTRIVWLHDGEPGWRKVSYYFPDVSVYVLEEGGDWAVLSSKGRLMVNNTPMATYPGPSPIRVPIPKGARLIWVLGTVEAEKLRDIVPLQSAPPLYYTDLPEAANEFQFGSFIFSPE